MVFCAGLFITSVAHHVKLITPTLALTTMYGITNSLFSGCGFFIANVIGGILYEKYGIPKLFWGASIFAFS